VSVLFLRQWISTAFEAVMQVCDFYSFTCLSPLRYIVTQGLKTNKAKKEEDDPGLSDVGCEMLARFLKEQLSIPPPNKAFDQVASLQAKLVLIHLLPFPIIHSVLHRTQI
jgi:hypothetical protein